MTYRLNRRRFLAWFVGLTLGLPLLLMAISAATGINLESSATSVLPMMIAAMIEGQAFAREEQRRPTGPEAWRAARQMFTLALIVSLVLGAVVVALTPGALALVSGEFALLFGALFAGILLAMFLLARFFFGLGAKATLKQMERQT